MRQYIMCYTWIDKKGRNGLGNQSVYIDMERMTLSQLETMIAELRERYNYKSVVILNMIPFGKEIKKR